MPQETSTAMLEPHSALAGLNSKLAEMQCWGHGKSPVCGDLARNPSLHTKNLGNFNSNSLGGENRQVFSWVSPSPRDLGGDPAAKSLGSKSASSWHIALLALEECMTKKALASSNFTHAHKLGV